MPGFVAGVGSVAVRFIAWFKFNSLLTLQPGYNSPPTYNRVGETQISRSSTQGRTTEGTNLGYSPGDFLFFSAQNAYSTPPSQNIF